MTHAILITNGQIITPAGTLTNGWLHCENGKIAGLGQDETPKVNGVEQIDVQGRTVLPGFIDLHVHGGVDREAMDASRDGLTAMARFYAQHGVTSFLATTWTDSAERIYTALECIAASVGPQGDGATLLGAHLEGPYLNPEKCGAQSSTHIRRADRTEALKFLDLDVIRLLALAPEFEDNHWLITECAKRGVTVSAAHTAATYEQMCEAVTLGVRQATHTYNAMTGLHHRKPGTVGAVLTLSEIRCELIADNIHVHPAAMKLVFLAKGPEGVILITDAIRSAGMPDGEYPIDDRVVTVRDGVVRLEDGTLAGSTLTMDRALYNFMQATGQPVDTIWRTSSLNAACALNVNDRKGSLELGKDADFVIVDESINVYLTVVEGRIVFQKEG